MEGRICCFVLAMQIVSWVSATSRSFAPNDSFGVPQPGVTGQSPLSLQVPSGSKLSPQSGSTEGFEKMGRVTVRDEEEEANSFKGESKIGSSPPSCEHKCYGCIPCEAIQVPTTSKQHSHSRVSVQYTNYEPEGWKCKCGPSFYTP